MSREIAVNSTTLKKEVSTMKKAMQQLKNQINEAYTAVRDLDKMWDGPANAAFLTEFNQDRQTLLGFCDSLERLIESIEMSRVEYEKCEADVKVLVDSIKI